MKIVNVILTSQNGGAEQVFVDYINVFKKLGHQVFAIVKDDAPYAGKVSKLCEGVRKTSNYLGFHDFIAVKNIAKFLQEFDADLVVAHTGRASCLVQKALKKIKNKKIFCIAVNHSMNVKRSVGADLILSVNREIFYRTVEFGQNENRSFVVHNATDLADALDFIPQTSLEKKSEIVLGVIGRFDVIKSFEFAIRAVAALNKISTEKKLGKKFLLKIAGSGPQESFLRDVVCELRAQECVEFVSWVENKKSFFESLDIFCLTSRRETFGLVLLEAMKFGKPIISTACDGPKEILRDGIDGLLIDIENFEGIENRIADAVLRIVSSDDLAKRMAENSLQKVKEKFSYEALAAKLQDLVGPAVATAKTVQR